jgi:hypothetical protein
MPTLRIHHSVGGTGLLNSEVAPSPDVSVAVKNCGGGARKYFEQHHRH